MLADWSTAKKIAGEMSAKQQVEMTSRKANAEPFPNTPVGRFGKMWVAVSEVVICKRVVDASEFEKCCRRRVAFGRAEG